MKKFLLCLLQLVLVSPFAARANDSSIGNEKTMGIRNYEPVTEVRARETGDGEAEVVWSWQNMPLIEGFETGDFSMFSWNNGVDDNYPWAITTTNPYEGTYCMKSTNEGVDSSSSIIEVTVDIPEDGVMSFYIRLTNGSEAMYDGGYFSINGVRTTTFVGDIENWSKKEYELTAGEYTFKWEYVKDNMYSAGEDIMYIDYIDFSGKPEPAAPGWLYYDDGTKVDALGLTSGGPFYWGIMFPVATTSRYDGYSLRKVSMFDTTPNSGNILIYRGGTSSPATLVHTQPYTNTGSQQFVEFELSNAIAIDTTQSLWIVLNTDGGESVAAMCNDTGRPNGRWISVDGAEWIDVLTLGFPGTFMLRGYVDNSKGEMAMLTELPYENKATGGVLMSEPNPKTIVTDNLDFSKDMRAVSSYNVYRASYNDETGSLLTNTSDTLFVDNTWGELPFGEYKYGIEVEYEDGGKSPIVWSNNVEKDVWTTLDVIVTTDAGSPSGTKVQFVNITEPDMGYDLEILLGSTGVYSWDKVRKGTYQYTIYKNGYISCADGETIEIMEPESIECELQEIIEGISDLYVSPTGWAMWTDNAVSQDGAEFEFGFEDGTLAGWTTIDADSDGNVWGNIASTYGTGFGHSGSYYSACSESYHNATYSPLAPDNYLVTEQKYLIGDNSILTFYVSALDAAYPAEHYGVALSVAGNTDAADFITIDEWTLTAKNAGTAKAARGMNGQGAWYEKTVDLSDFAGQEVYIAIRHFDCSDEFVLLLDDVSLKNETKATRALEGYKVMLNNVLETEVTTMYHQHDVTDLVEGQQYTTSVAAVYTSGESEYSEYTWTYSDCSNYESVTPSATVEGSTITLTWENESVSDEIGILVFRDGELLTSEPLTTTSYVDENVESGVHNYCVRTVYDGFVMSCPACIDVHVLECTPPEDLYGEYVFEDNETYGVNLIWPYSNNITGEWLYYDNGTMTTAPGNEGYPFYWGVMFPTTTISGYNGASLTKVQMYDYSITGTDYNSAGDYTLNIYYGGTTAPGTLIHTQDFTMTGANVWHEIEFTTALPLDVTQNVWVVMYNEGTNRPMAACDNTGDPNGRWISPDGSSWYDALDLGVSCTFMIRAFITNSVKGGEMVELPGFEGKPGTEGKFDAKTLTSPVATSPITTNRNLTQYNVYRSTTNSNYELIAEVEAGSKAQYFDDLTGESGTYYYQVTALYEEDGETCESAPAASYLNPDQDYVMVEVTNVAENGNSNVAVYPNPTKGDLRIEAEGMNRITVTSVHGQVVMDKAVTNDYETIDMSQMEAGVYMIHILSESGMTVKRINVIR